jgi:hypothetical protein
MERRAFLNVAASGATALALNPYPFLMAGEQVQKSTIAYPDPSIEVLDPRFAKYRVVSAASRTVVDRCALGEGQVWFGDGRYLLFSDIPNNRMMRWPGRDGRGERFRSPSNYSNGNTVTARDGWLRANTIRDE